MPLSRLPLRIAMAGVLGSLLVGCVAVPGDGYYEGGGGYYPGHSAVTVYEQPGVIYGAPPVGWRNYPAPPVGWREEAWRERQWRESRERDAYQRREMDRRRDAQRWEADRQRDQWQRDAERQREQQQRDAERRRDMDRRAYEQRQQQYPQPAPRTDMRDLLERRRSDPRPDWR